ncbi:MAG: hypothetical protein GKR99_06895 [Rhodobacteraceae bacterium]|nr:hypothetical protein [Paracoccaceae bacterium]
MTALKTLMAGGALIALMATPALSLDIGGSVSGGASGGGSTGGIATSVGLKAFRH